MAKVYITEFVSVGGTGNFPVQGALADGQYTEQTPITTSGSSQQSAAFQTNTKFVRIHTDGIMSIAFGVNPTATVNTMRLAANQTEYFSVIPGQKLAVITNT